MSNFEVYKDIVLFLRKVYLRQIHQRPNIEERSSEQNDLLEQIALDTLTSPWCSEENKLLFPGLPLRNAQVQIKAKENAPLYER